MRALRVVLLTVALVAGYQVTASAGATTLKSRLLTVTELPNGWSVTYQPGGALNSAHCFTAFRKPSRHSQRAQITFTMGGSTSLGENLGSGPGSVAQLHRLNHELRSCHRSQLTSQGKTLQLTIAPMSFPKVSKTSAAFLLSASVTGFQAGFDVVTFRTAKYVGDLIYGGLGSPDVTTFLSFAREAIAKVEGKHVSVPSTVPPTATG